MDAIKTFAESEKNLNVQKKILDEIINNTNWDHIINLSNNDTNMCMNNFFNHVTYILDELAPYKKLSKREIKLKSKPWINNNILFIICN